MADEQRLTFHAFGFPGARRLVVLLGVGRGMTVDPLPSVTVGRDVRVVAIALAAAAIEDPGAFGGETRAEQTAASVAALVREELAMDRSGPGASAGLVAYRAAADVGLRAAIALGAAVDRLALVAVQVPETPFDRDEFGRLISAATAKSLIMNGTGDEPAGNAAAAWYRQHLVDARVEMVPREGPLTLPAVWDRVLAHVAPGTKRK